MPKILIVDDEPFIRQSIEAGLQAKGFETVTAEDGEEAVTRALRSLPDLILLDVMMPKLDGMSVCKRLKTLMGGFVPIILVTAMGTNDDKQTGTDHGADDYLVKPFKIDELLTRITAMLRIKAKHEALQKNAETDFVTGVYNRRYLQSRLRTECLQAARAGTYFTCLMVDMDDFKSVNDTYGHLIGDKVLKRIADVLAEFSGTADVVARYGGDEFVLLFPGMPVESGVATAERIRTAMQDREFVEGDTKLKLTCSIGVASFPANNLTDADDLLRAMDCVLYSAKKSGRNAVTVHSGS